MQGKIVKGIAGFYYVHTEDNSVYECKAKGAFRNDKIKPLVGDNVEIQIINDKDKLGNVEQILKRKNTLIRPAVSNVDQALIIFAIHKPEPNLNLLDRFLIHMELLELETVICFNKMDTEEKNNWKKLQTIYESSGYKVLFVSAKEEQGIDALYQVLTGKTTTVAGPSGVGKSSIINRLQPIVLMETGAISEKIERGKHTTRHSELIAIEKDTYIMDTPGFSSLSVEQIEKDDLKYYYREFRQYEEYCRFHGCAHIHEPNCGVKEALQEGKITKERYDSYVLLYEELKQQRKRR